jgi:hypothetical protein
MKYPRGVTRAFLVGWAVWLLVFLVALPLYIVGEAFECFWVIDRSVFQVCFDAHTFAAVYTQMLHHWSLVIGALVGVPAAVYGLICGMIATIRWLIGGFRNPIRQVPTLSKETPMNPEPPTPPSHDSQLKESVPLQQQGSQSDHPQLREAARRPNTWLKLCARLALLVIAIVTSFAFYFTIYLPRERGARLEAERHEQLAADQRERARLETQRQAEEALYERLSRGRAWKTIHPYTDVNVALSTSWRNGLLYYRLTFWPDVVRFRIPSDSCPPGANSPLCFQMGLTVRPSHEIIVDLLDSSGFRVKEVYIPAIALYHMQQKFEANESFPFPRSDYVRIDDWNLRWTLR